MSAFHVSVGHARTRKMRRKRPSVRAVRHNGRTKSRGSDLALRGSVDCGHPLRISKMQQGESMRTPQRNLLARLVLAICFLIPMAEVAGAQTAYVPYFGKNQIRYDNFDWHTYTTEHF